MPAHTPTLRSPRCPRASRSGVGRRPRAFRVVMWGRSGWWCRRTGPCESARPCKLSPRKDVRSRLLMQERSIVFGSLLGVDNNLERFVGDLDLIERVFCERPSLAQDRDDRLADITGFFVRVPSGAR